MSTLLFPLFAARLNELWYALPLIVSVSLVNAGTRYEHAEDILIGSFRSAIWIFTFMAVIFAALWLAGLMI